MPWWPSTWALGAGWTTVYALAVWGISVAQSLLEPWTARRKWQHVASWVSFLAPLALAFLIGALVRSWL